jgi:hypothetical protein
MPEQAQIIRWQDPPPARGNPSPKSPTRSRYDQVAVQLVANPFRSALLENGPRRNKLDQIAAGIRTGRMRCFAPAGDFDACVRVAGDGTFNLFAWYVGDGENGHG